MFDILFGNGKPNYFFDMKFVENFPDAKPYLSKYDEIILKDRNTYTVDIMNGFISKYNYSKIKIPLDVNGDIKKQIIDAFPNLK